MTEQHRIALLQSTTARVIVLISPAGYGKTTIANAMRAQYASSAICDCMDAQSPMTFARSVILALANESPDQAAFFTDLQAQLSSAESDAGISGILDTAWSKKHAGQSCFIFENAEIVAGNSAVAWMLTRLLNIGPQERRIIVCSRVPLPARASRYLPPHQILTLTKEFFALGEPEAFGLLEQYGVDPKHRATIIRLAGGWPVVLLLLARLAAEQRLEQAISDIKHVAFDDLFVYLLREVLEPLDERVRCIMTLCAAVPNVSTEELRSVSTYTDVEFETAMRRAALIERDGDSYRVHPILRDLLLQDDHDWPKLVASVAEFAQAREDYTRAATLYRIAGDMRAAARVLTKIPLQALQVPENVYELVQLPLLTLQEHPKLIGAAEPYRSDISTTLLQHTFENLSEDDAPDVVAAVAECYTDRITTWEGVLEVLHSPLVERAAHLSSSARTMLAGWEETKAFNLRMATASVEQQLLDAYDTVNSAGLTLYSARLASYLAGLRRRRCDRAGCMYWREVALRHGRQCGPRIHATMLLSALSDAWFWGDDDTVAAYHEELMASESTSGAREYTWVIRALDPKTSSSALPLWEGALTQRAILIVASKVTGNERGELLAAAASVKNPARAFPVFLAQAANEPERRAELCDKIAALIDPAEMPEVHAGVLAYAQGLPSALDAFTRRFELSPHTTAGAVSTVYLTRLEILRERLVINGTAMRLTPREATLLAFLSRRKTGTTREEIQDALWPDLDEIGARDSLYSLLHRLRKRSAKAEIVTGIGNAYRLGEEVQVDLWDMHFLAQKVQRNRSENLLADVERAYAEFKQRAYPHLQQYEWFSAIEFQVHEDARILARYLITQAQERGKTLEIATYAGDLIGEDACDEWAHQVLIETFLRQGDRAEAARAYRNYCKLLKDQIEAQPSSEIRDLALTAHLV